MFEDTNSLVASHMIIANAFLDITVQIASHGELCQELTFKYWCNFPDSYWSLSVELAQAEFHKEHW